MLKRILYVRIWLNCPHYKGDFSEYTRMIKCTRKPKERSEHKQNMYCTLEIEYKVSCLLFEGKIQYWLWGMHEYLFAWASSFQRLLDDQIDHLTHPSLGFLHKKWLSNSSWHIHRQLLMNLGRLFISRHMSVSSSKKTRSRTWERCTLKIYLYR